MLHPAFGAIYRYIPPVSHVQGDQYRFLVLRLLSAQQRPAEMEWYTPKCIGEVPNKRSGHTFTIVKGGIGYVFGGKGAQMTYGPFAQESCTSYKMKHGLPGAEVVRRRKCAHDAACI